MLIVWGAIGAKLHHVPEEDDVSTVTHPAVGNEMGGRILQSFFCLKLEWGQVFGQRKAWRFLWGLSSHLPPYPTKWKHQMWGNRQRCEVKYRPGDHRSVYAY